MKKIKLALLCFGLVLGTVLFAQPNKEVQAKQPTKEQPIEMLNSHFGEGLNLSSSQTAKIAEIRKSFAEERQKRLNDESSGSMNSAAEVEKLHQLENEKLWEVLTPEQARKYKNMRVVPDAADNPILPTKEKSIVSVAPQRTISSQQATKEQPIEMLNSHFGEGLRLTRAQKIKIERIQKSFADERQKMLNDEGSGNRNNAAEIEKSHQMENEQLWEVLTPKQARKYKNMRVVPDAADTSILPTNENTNASVVPQKTNVSQPLQAKQSTKEQPIEMLNSHFGEGLNLSSSQIAKIAEIRKRFAEQRQKMLNDESSGSMNHDAEIEKSHQLENEKLWEVLTPEQASKYKNMKVVPDAPDTSKMP